MQVSIKGNTVTVTFNLLDEPYESKSGNSIIVASDRAQVAHKDKTVQLSVVGYVSTKAPKAKKERKTVNVW